MIPIPEIVWVILGYIIVGMLGAISRMFVQIVRDGWANWRKEKLIPDIIVEILLGGIAGYVAFLLVQRLNLVDHITAYALGYVAPDALVNIAERFRPDKNKDDET